MSPETIKAIKSWLNFSPESCHPCDMERFYNIFKVARDNGDLCELSYFDLEPYFYELKPKASDEFVQCFCSKWHARISLCANLLIYVR